MNNHESKSYDAVTLAVKKIVLAALFVLTVFSAEHFYNISINVREKGFMDTPMFLYQAGFFINSGKLYTNPLKEGGELADSVKPSTKPAKQGSELEGFEPLVPWYKFPPAYLLAYMPWVPLIDSNFEKYANTVVDVCREIWAVHIIRYILSLTMILMLLNSTGSKFFLLNGLSMGLLFTPFFESLSGLNFDSLLVFVLAIIILLNRLKRDELSGLVIGAVSMFKLYPALLILWAVAVKNIKIIFFLVISCLLLLGLSLLVFGVENHVFFYVRLLPLLLNESSLTGTINLSLGKFFVQQWEDVHIAMQYFDVFRKSVLATAFVLLWRYGRHPDGCTRLAAIKLSLITCTMLIYLPNYWWNYQLVLILPVLTLLAGAYAKQGAVWQGAAAIICWFVMVCSDAGSGEYTPFNLREYWYVANVIPGYCPYVPLVLWLAMALALLTYAPAGSRAPGATASAGS